MCAMLSRVADEFPDDDEDLGYVTTCGRFCALGSCVCSSDAHLGTNNNNNNDSKGVCVARVSFALRCLRRTEESR